ncbi:Transamidase GatB domain protein [hydrothermal vent metagenome]|uniref:Transamidase GatB domain protein n=1 Tax=hydrothermal vent metagenome TaxID=652676 RepID=A0A3B1DH96_9ZZZZ
MSILERIDSDLKVAMKSSEKIKVSTLRMVKASLKNLEIEKGELSDDDVIGVLSTQAKQRRESISEFEKGGRQDLADQEREELAVILGYLPEQLSEEELTGIILETIKETGASSLKDMGRLMKSLMPRVKGRADGKLVSRKVKELLGKQ